MMTLPAGSSTYRVFCGSRGRQSAAGAVASTSAEGRGRGAGSVAALGGGGTEVAGVTGGAAREVAACATRVSAASTGSAVTFFKLGFLNTEASANGLDGLDQLGACLLRIAVQHPRVVQVEQRVLDSGESRTLAALDDDDVLGLVGVENRHSVDRAGLVVARHGIDDVVGANDQGNVCGLELGVDFVQIGNEIVRDAGFRQQDVHVSGHASGDRMDSELDGHTAIEQQL